MVISSSMVLLILAIISNAIMDLSSENKFTNPWWNKRSSADNKWRLDKDNNRVENFTSSWYYFNLFVPKYKESFPMSSTVLVGFTDGWHLTQTIFHSSWQLMVAINVGYPIVTFFVIKCLFSLGFEFVYRKIKNKGINFLNTKTKD